MFDRLKRLFGAPPVPEAELSPALAAAALMVEAARADGHYARAERAIIDEALAADFAVAPDDCARLRADAERLQDGAAGIYRFTRALKPLASEMKIRLVEHLWRVILCDGERDSFEDSLVRQACGLLYVSDVDSGAARQRVAADLRR
jgi:uncharacterized tellurite resistance protein B-like protein